MLATVSASEGGEKGKRREESAEVGGVGVVSMTGDAFAVVVDAFAVVVDAFAVVVDAFAVGGG